MTYHREVEHKGLNKRKVITGKELSIVNLKAEQQLATWEGEWQRKQAREAGLEQARQQADAKRGANLSEKEQLAAHREDQKEAAAERTQESGEAQEAIESLLKSAIGESHALVWSALEEDDPFPEPQPAKPLFVPDDSPFPTPPPARPPARPKPPAPPEPPRPARNGPQYRPTLHGVQALLPAAKREAEKEMDRRCAEDLKAWSRAVEERMDAWRQQVRELERADAATQAAYAVQRRQWEADWRAHAEAQAARNTQAELAVEAEYAEEVARWEARRADFEEQQREQDEAGQRMQQQYLSGEPSAVEEYCGFVLAASEYPESFPDEQDVAFNCENGMLIVDFALPTKDALPKLKEVKYVQTKDDFTESYLSDSYLNAMYDGALYQVALRTLHELFDADSADALAAITFNGWVTNTDPATGREVKACIMSVQTTKEEFAKINLAAVDPKACFRSLKGISAAKLHIVTPIAPVLTMSREDKRFVASYDVTGELDDSYNLACMDWEDFEHLIRELFEEEFTQSGGEVKVTQASRDGGVDAVAFDPDPIRGGKIVIQAKRYTNTVGVSAVRDLYGTVMNEGATKGILVTTSEYGPDAYEFARGKPLTLLSGGNLLSLLEKHGHKAKIDLVDARRIMHEREQMEGESHG